MTYRQATYSNLQRSITSSVVILFLLTFQFFVQPNTNLKRSGIFLMVKAGRIKASFLCIVIYLHRYRPNILLLFLDAIKMYCLQRLISNNLSMYIIFCFLPSLLTFTEANPLCELCLTFSVLSPDAFVENRCVRLLHITKRTQDIKLLSKFL